MLYGKYLIEHLVEKGGGWFSDIALCCNTDSFFKPVHTHNSRLTFRIIYYIK